MGCNKTKIIIGPKERCNKPTNSYILYHFIKTRNLNLWTKLTSNSTYRMWCYKHNEYAKLVIVLVYMDEPKWEIWKMIRHIKSTSHELVSLRLGQNTKYSQWKGPQPYRARTKDLESKNMHYLQAVFTTLWSIWNHGNQATHEGKTPNPLEVILTIQSLICRYKEAFSNCAITSHRSTDQKRCDQKIRGPS